MVKLEDLITERIVGIPIKSQNITADDVNHSEVLVIKVKDLKNGTVSRESIEILKLPSDERNKRSSVVKGDVVISVAGNFKAALIDESIEGAVINNHLVALRMNDKIKSEVIVAYLNSPAGQEELLKHSTGKAMQSISIKKLHDVSIPVSLME